MGLFTVTEESGRVYPYSDQANSVVDVLRFALEKQNITLHTGFEVKKIRHDANGFAVQSDAETILCDRVIVACGGLAGTKLGGSMSGYKLLAQMGHRSTRLRPTLVQLKSGWGGIGGLKGVRANCHIAILKDRSIFSKSTGEIQFTDYGISGPVVFEVSRDVCNGAGDWSAVIDFLPECSEETLLNELCRRRQSVLTTEELLTGILHNRLGKVLTRAAGIKDQRPVSTLRDDQLVNVSRTVKSFEMELTEPRSPPAVL